jgi:glycosyltransferase involved in cell wall biosynthesis
MLEAGWKTHVAFAFEGPLLEVYEESGHVTTIVPHSSWLRHCRTDRFVRDIWQEWQKAHAFEALLEGVQPDIVYLNTAVSLAGVIAARRAGVRCIWHLREMFSDIGGEMHAPRWAMPFVRKIFQWGATRLVANSTPTAVNLLGEGAAHQATIIPNAVRSDFFEEDQSRETTRRMLHLPLKNPLIGVPGTFRPAKGHPFFLRAIEPLLIKDPSLQVAITGGMESLYAEDVRQQAGDLAGADRVHFVGWVEDMPAFYRACDVVCIPSRAEPFGRTAIEAFAAGTPVVASAVGGLQEIITDSETGLLVPYDDDEALRAALHRLLSSPDLRRKMSAHAREAAEEKYHEQVYKKRVASIVGAFLSEE